jgi:hypothetical protein
MRTYWLRRFFMARELKYLWGSVWQPHAPLYREEDKKNRIQTAFCSRLHDGIRFSIKYNGKSLTVEHSSQKCEIILWLVGRLSRILQSTQNTF